MKRFLKGLLVLCVAGALALPWLSPPVYFVSLLFGVFMYVVLAESWVLIGGFAGYLSFGHGAFLGIGAYATALLMNHFHLSPIWVLVSALPAGVAAACIAAVIAYPALRLRGPYFALITLCFAFVMELVVKNLDFFGGPEGLWLKAMGLKVGVARGIFFELMFGLMIVTIVTVRRVETARFGMGLKAIKEDEEVAQTLCIDAPRVKLSAFVLSAFFPGVAGGLYAYYLSYIHPESVFNIDISILIVLMALFGGGSSYIGPIVGAISLSLINELLSAFLKAEYARVIYGLLFILLILYLPNGVISFFRKEEARGDGGDSHGPAGKAAIDKKNSL